MNAEGICSYWFLVSLDILLSFVFNVKLLSFKRGFFLSYRSLMYFLRHEGYFFFLVGIKNFRFFRYYNLRLPGIRFK